MRWWKYRLTCLKLSTGNDDTLWRETEETRKSTAEGAEKGQIKTARQKQAGGRYKFKSEVNCGHPVKAGWALCVEFGCDYFSGFG
jgi:hypothetical protein